jgi:hypothetical protein
MNPNANEAEVDRVLKELEPLVVRGHYNIALERLAEAFERAMAEDPQAGRALIEKIHLIAGSRRMHARAVSLDKRRFKT